MYVCMHVGREGWAVCVHPANLNSEDSSYSGVVPVWIHKIKIITISIIAKAAVACAAHMQSLAREAICQG